MEILRRITNTFENVRSTVKSRKSSDRLQLIKNGIQSLGSELEVLGKENHDQFVRSLAMGGYLALLSAKTMPMSVIEKRNILQAAYNKLQPYSLRGECLFVFLRTQNLLCFNLIQLDQLTEAQRILEATEELYEKIDREHSHRYLDAEELFSPEPINNINTVNPDKIDKVITNNVLMQAYLYNKMNMLGKYTLYNHTALRRQLEMKEGTAQDWAMRTARLGNYFTHICQLGNAHYHLCAAYHVLRSCHDNCRLVPEEFVQQKADFEMNFLELSHYWVKYGLCLFKVSKKKILSKYFSDTSKTDLWRTVEQLGEGEKKNEEDIEITKDFGSEKNGEGDFSQLYSFPTLNLKEMEARVPSEPVSGIEAARKLFTFTHKWLMRAKHYYDMEQYASQYISCSMQLAELYEHLVFFEKNVDAQYALQRRRAEVLESLTALLKSCDMTTAVQIDVIRELGQVQLELMALNLQKLWREESRTNIFNLEHDCDSFVHSLGSAESMKTLTEKTLNASSKNLFLHKMEAATALNGKLFRLSGQLQTCPPSQLSFGSTVL